jgi:sigma-54 dependent transcriptional regulator, flagellar regulatory protein
MILEPRNRFALIGTSGAIREVRDLIRKVAPTDSNVLILGESGTGKELAARQIHEFSPRVDLPFVPVNCGAIPPELLESELFGHEKGAFTGALSMRAGRFEFAEGGTLFLDEIGDMPMQMQVKLLRVLQERVFERVGSNRQMRCNVRIVAATHRDLDVEVREGRFREDLYYRLNVFPIHIPPLRERPTDLPLLIEHLLAAAAGQKACAFRLTDEAIGTLARFEWPGNVRELGNLIERLSILFPGGTVRSADLPSRYRPMSTPESIVVAADRSVVCELEPGSLHDTETDDNNVVNGKLPRGGLDLKKHLLRIESDLIGQALAASDGRVAGAARLLHLRRTTLVEKIRKGGAMT